MVSIISLISGFLACFPPTVVAIFSTVILIGLIVFLLKLIKLILDAIPFV